MPLGLIPHRPLTRLLAQTSQLSTPLERQEGGEQVDRMNRRHKRHRSSPSIHFFAHGRHRQTDEC
jgi:hypothetical protein